jgi:L-fuconolactonase
VAEVIADWKKTPGTVGIRIILTKESKRAPDDPGLDRILRAAVKNELPASARISTCSRARTAPI